MWMRLPVSALVNAMPAKHHYPERAKPKLGAFVAFIDEVLAADRQAPQAAVYRASAVSSHPGASANASWV